MSNYPPYQFQPYQPTMGPYMPSQPYQTRMDMQGQAQPVQPSQTAPQSQQGAIMGLSTASRPVTSREEAMGVAADFSGALMLFPDVTHDRVYIKRWDLAAGGPAFQEYAPVTPVATEPVQVPRKEQPSWVSIQDFQDLQDVVDQLKSEIDRLKKPAGRTGGKNDADGK